MISVKRPAGGSGSVWKKRHPGPCNLGSERRFALAGI